MTTSLQVSSAKAGALATDGVGGVRNGFVTMRVNGQVIGVPVLMVQDVLRHMDISRIPLAPSEIAGSMNLRGRIVTVIDMRKRLQLPPIEEGAKVIHVVVEQEEELYSFMVDSVGDVLNLSIAQMESNPVNMEANWSEVTKGIYRLEKELLLVLDVQALLTF